MNAYSPLPLKKKSTLYFLCLAILLSLACNSSRAATILVLGDSLSAAYRLDVDQGWVNLMAQQLGSSSTVLNASISGETTQGGLARLPQLLKKYQPDWVILELGANDGLQGLSLQTLRRNLQAMIDLSKAAGANVLLIGNHIPPNYGRVYTERFFQTYAELAEANQLPLVPFMLQGVAIKPGLMQADGMHPTANAQPLILATIASVFYPLLENRPVAKPVKTSQAERSTEKLLTP